MRLLTDGINQSVHEFKHCFCLYSLFLFQTTLSKSTKSGSDDITCNSVTMTREKVVFGEDVVQESEYVYDLYYTDCLEFDLGEHSVGMKSDGDDLVYEYFADEPPHANDDEDDENDESNWRNDYPDDDDEHSKCDEDIIKQKIKVRGWCRRCVE